MCEQETLSSSTASEELVMGNLAARMAAVSCMHQLAVMAGSACASPRKSDPGTEAGTGNDDHSMLSPHGRTAPADTAAGEPFAPNSRRLRSAFETLHGD